MSNNIRKIPQYNTMLFTDVWDNAEDFLADYEEAGVFTEPVIVSDVTVKAGTKLSDDEITLLFYLLYSRYGNSPIANWDINQFKYKVYTTIFQYGPSWSKKLELQEKLRALTEDDILRGGKAIYNTALNPSTAPSTQTLEELTYINAQNTTNYKKSKMDAYAQLWELIDLDVTNEFLNKFRPCFKTFVMPERPLLYVTEEDESEEEEGE